MQKFDVYNALLAETDVTLKKPTHNFCCFRSKCAALKFPKVENNKRFLFAVYFQNKAHYPTVKYFYTYWVLFLISTFLRTTITRQDISDN